MNNNQSKPLLRIRDLVLIIVFMTMVVVFLPNKWFPIIEGPFHEVVQVGDVSPDIDKEVLIPAGDLLRKFKNAEFILRDTEFGYVLWFNTGGEVSYLSVDDALPMLIQGNNVEWPPQTQDFSLLRLSADYWTLENVFNQKPDSEIYEDSYDFVLYKLPDELGGKVVSARMSSLGESYLVRIPVNEFQKGLVYSFLNKAP